MSEQGQLPSSDEMKVFSEKLSQFRSTLGPTEQRILDTMAAAAFARDDAEGDVKPYWYVVPGPAVPVTQPVPAVVGYNFWGQPIVGTTFATRWVQGPPVWVP